LLEYTIAVKLAEINPLEKENTNFFKENIVVLLV